MSEDEKKQIRKLQAILLSIDIWKPRFFNIEQYKKRWLIIVRNKRWPMRCWVEEIIDTKYCLTAKARQYMNVVI